MVFFNFVTIMSRRSLQYNTNSIVTQEYEDYLEGNVNNFVPNNIFKNLKL